MPKRKVPEVKQLRFFLRETQTEFAKRFGVNQATIHRWETMGVPKHGTARVAMDNLLMELRRKSA